MKPALTWTGIAITALLTPIHTAHASSLTRVTGDWINPVGGGTSIEFMSVDNENRILWGTPAQAGKSGLGFIGGNVAEVALDTPFLVGTLRHFNTPIFAPNLDQVSLAVDLALDNIRGVSLSRSFTFNFDIDETVNVTPCAYASTQPCADRITFLNPTASETILLGRTNYTLELLGFSDRPTSDGILVSEFISQEEGISTAFLFGRLTAASTPEPGAIAALSVLGLYLLSRRR